MTEVIQGSKDLAREHRFHNSLSFSERCWVSSLDAMLSHYHFLLPSTVSIENASVQHKKTFIRHFVVCFLPPKKLPVIFQSHCQVSVWLFLIFVVIVLTLFAERALLACADRLEFKISTVIIFHRLLVDGNFHLACEFACSEIGRRSRWL